MLVLARGEIVPAERIADCLWADDLPGNVSGAVQSYVSHLRRRLQPDGAPFLYGKGAQGFRNGPFVAWGRSPL